MTNETLQVGKSQIASLFFWRLKVWIDIGRKIDNIKIQNHFYLWYFKLQNRFQVKMCNVLNIISKI